MPQISLKACSLSRRLPCDLHKRIAHVKAHRCFAKPRHVRLIVHSSRKSDDPGGSLSREFFKHVNETGAPGPLQNRRPSHLLPPTAAIAAQLNALQLNDWPEPSAGVQTAYVFTKPRQCEELMVGPVLPGEARSWRGKEEWLSLSDFTDMLWSEDYRPLINCDSWQATSPLVFPSQRVGTRAVQTVEVMSQPVPGTEMQRRPHTYTFCLEHITKGAYKGCWMTVGLRLGDYGNV